MCRRGRFHARLNRLNRAFNTDQKRRQGGVSRGKEGGCLGRAITVFADFCASTISAAAAAFAVLANLMHARALGFVCTHHETIYKKHKHHKDPQKARTSHNAIHKKHKHHTGPPSQTSHRTNLLNTMTLSTKAQTSHDAVNKKHKKTSTKDHPHPPPTTPSMAHSQ